jgi:hypothetical protein
VLFAGFIFNTGAFVLTVFLLNVGFVELNPITATLFRLWGFAGTYLFALFTYFSVVRLFSWIALNAPSDNRLFIVPVFGLIYSSFDFSRNLLLLAEKGGMV